MSRLFFLILTIAVSTCAGIGVIVALVTNNYTWQAIVLYGGVGAVVGVIASWVVARRLEQHEEDRGRDPS